MAPRAKGVAEKDNLAPLLKAWRKKTTKSFSVRCEKPFKVLSHALKTARAVLSWLGVAETEGFFGALTHFSHPLGSSRMPTPTIFRPPRQCTVGDGVLDIPPISRTRFFFYTTLIVTSMSSGAFGSRFSFQPKLLWRLNIIPVTPVFLLMSSSSR